MLSETANGANNEVLTGVFLADGTRISASGGAADGFLWIWTDDGSLSIADAAALFSQPDKVGRIRYVRGPEQETVWTGYTRLITLQRDDDDKLSIRLRKEWKDV